MKWTATPQDIEKIQQSFWFRDWDRKEWAKAFLDGNLVIMEHTMKWLRPEPVIRVLGRDRFVAAWPTLRERVKDHATLVRRMAAYDTWWSMAATATLDIKPLGSWARLRGRRREFLLAIAKHQGSSIYALSKQLGRQYRRAYGHARALEVAGYVKSREELIGGRRVRRLFASQAASTQ